MTESNRIWINDKWEAYLRPTFDGDTSGYIRADLLTDPVTVHANMLRGTIAKPTVEQIIHLYGADALMKALASIEYERKVAQMKEDFPNGI